MNRPLNIRGRDARDRLASLLGLGVPHPLRDLELEYVEMVAQGVSPQIRILAAQAGVTYRLCDDDGDPVPGVAVAEGGGSAGFCSLQTPPVVEDVAFTILASRRVGTAVLEAYLSARVSIKAGINTGLDVEFVPTPGQLASGDQIVVSYQEPVTVLVRQTQEGVYYRLVQEAPKDVFLSPEELLGTQGELRFTTAVPVTEDLGLRIKAYRKIGKLKPTHLETRLRVLVRPNAGVTVTTSSPVVDFGGKVRIALSGVQDTARYELWAGPVAPSDFLPADASGGMVVPTPQSDREHVSLSLPVRPVASEAPPGFFPKEPFTAVAAGLEVELGPLTEDAFFLVRAAKSANQETLLLDATAAVLVRPDTRPTVTAEPVELEPGAAGFVVVSGTQPGVQYRLRRASDGAELGAPGFHHEDRGIETVRVGVDLVVEEAGDPRVMLPTGPLDETTSFRVVAVRTVPGIRAELNGSASITVKTAPSPEAPAGPRAVPRGKSTPRKSRRAAAGRVPLQSSGPDLPPVPSAARKAAGAKATGPRAPASKPAVPRRRKQGPRPARPASATAKPGPKVKPSPTGAKPRRKPRSR